MRDKRLVFNPLGYKADKRFPKEIPTHGWVRRTVELEDGSKLSYMDSSPDRCKLGTGALLDDMTFEKVPCKACQNVIDGIAVTVKPKVMRKLSDRDRLRAFFRP